MKMVRAILRAEQEEKVIHALEKHGFVSYTRWEVIGRGKQKGVRKGGVHYLELYKTCLMIVVEDGEEAKLIQVLRKAAFTGKIGDGKIFVTPVEAAYTIRTGAAGL
ncbi:MAG: P-II family nitrogen regulator [bacterium]